MRVRRNGAQLGIAVTRNRALARVRAPLLLNADSDDVPEPGALDALADALEAEPDAGLAFGDWLEHWPDGGTFSPPVRFAPGRLAPGTLTSVWEAERWVPLHLAGALWRTDAVLAAGGWMALTGGSDIGLLVGVDATWASVYVPGVSFHYVHHAGQITADPEFQRRFDEDVELLRARARALRAAPVRR